MASKISRHESMQLLFLVDTERLEFTWTINIPCKNLMTAYEDKLLIFQDERIQVCVCVEIHFQKLQGLLRSWKSALWDSCEKDMVVVQ